MAVGDIKAEMVKVIRVIRTVGTGTDKDPVRTEVQYWEPNGKLIVKKDWQGDISQESMKESPEIDMERMKELLRSEPLTCIHKEEPKGVQENIDAVICVLSEDIVETIAGKKGFPCDGKEVVEKTQALASLVEASTRRCEKSVFSTD